jgi:hypothetical protein
MASILLSTFEFKDVGIYHPDHPMASWNLGFDDPARTSKD